MTDMNGPLCGWFALCFNDAYGTVEHPILGSIPTCQRCAEKHDLKLVPFTEDA